MVVVLLTLIFSLLILLPLFFTDAIGVPLFLFVELYRHRIHFYVKGDGTFSDRHDWAYQRLGDLFTQYE